MQREGSGEINGRESKRVGEGGAWTRYGIMRRALRLERRQGATRVFARGQFISLKGLRPSPGYPQGAPLIGANLRA